MQAVGVLYSNFHRYMIFFIVFLLNFQATISLWSKQSDSVVENSLVYLMNQNAALNFLKLPTFSQDTVVHTNVSKSNSHLSTAVAWREKKFKHFAFNQYFYLVLGVLKSKISKKFGEGFLRKLDFKLFHYKAMVQPVSKITTIATRNRCWM